MGKIFTKQYSPETGLLNKAGATGAGNTIVAGRLNLQRSSHLMAIVAKWLGLVLLVGMGVSVWGQTTLLSETFGTTAGTFPTGWTSSNTTNGFQAYNLGTLSNGYTGASSGVNARFNNTGSNSTAHTLTYSNSLSTIGYTTVTVLWGVRSTTTQPVTFQWSPDGTIWNTVSFTQNTNDGVWRLENGGTRITLPAGAANISNLRFRWSVTVNNSGIYSIDDFTVQGNSTSITPVKLAITSISPTSPTAGTGFSVTVAAQDASDVNGPVTANTGFSLTTNGNAGAIGGTTIGTITAGNTSVTITGVTLANAGTGVTITATQTSGDVLTVGISATFTVVSAAVIPWTNTGGATAWYTAGNWTPSTASVAWSTSNIAQFNNTGTANESGINLGTANLSIGAIEVTSLRPRVLTIGNSSGTVSGNVTFNGVNVNGVPNTILRNGSSSLFTLANVNPTSGSSQTTTYRLANATENVINTDGTGGITISAVLSSTAAGTLTKIGNGTLNLSSGGNTYTGKTVINAGFINTTGEGRLGANPSSFVADQITLNGGGIQSSTGDINFNSNRGITLAASGGTFDVGSGRIITLTNVVTGVGAFTKTGVGLLLMNGLHTYTGSSNVNAGTMRLGIANSFPDASALTVASGASFDLNGINETIGSLAGAGTVTSAATGNIALTTNVDNTSTSFSGLIQNGTATALGLTKSGTGTLTLSGTNTYTGVTTINAGTLSISTIANGGSNSNIGASSSAAANLVLGGGTLQYTGAAASTNRAFTLTAGTTSTIDVTTNTLTIIGAAAPTFGALNKAGNGTLVLIGANAHIGTTTVSAGVLNIQNATALGLTSYGTTVSNGAALEIQGGITVGAESLNLSGTGISNNGALRNISGTNSYGGVITLAAASTIQSDAGTLTLSGGIGGATFGLTLEGASGGTVSGVIATTTGTLTKNDGGTWTLTGSNAYTGVTTINAGTLRLNRIGGSTLPATAVVNINSGGTLQVSSDQTLNSLTLNTGATLTVDAGVTLTIAGTFTYNGGTISSTGSMAYTGGGVIIYNASRTAGIEWNAGNNPAAVTINTGTVTLNSTVTTSGSLTINSPGVLAAGSNTINIGGNWRNYASSGFTEATSTVIFNSSGSQSLNNDGGTEDFFSLSKTGTGTLTLNANAALAGTSSAFTLSNGIINTGNFGLSGTASSSFTISGGTLQLGRASTLPEFPTIANYSITGGTIELTGAGNQVLRGGIAYNNLIFSGSSGNKTITSAISSIASVTISGGNIVDVSNNTFGGATTDFTMTAGRFRTQGTGTKPDMANDYNLTGGVVEFYGNTGTIRSKAYQNIEVTGTNVGNSSGNITLNSGGTFTVKTGGAFSINADAITGPTGSQTVTVENGATFNCGNVEGFSGPPVGLNNPSIRETIETIDLQAGSTIAYTSATAQKFTARSDYKNVRINGAGEKTVQGASTIAGNLTLTSGILTTTSANPLTLTPTATTSGGSASSFVNGPLYKQMELSSADITMPVGKAPADYKPVILADVAGSGTNTFSAEYFPAGATSSPRNSILLGAILQSVWNGPYWQIDKTGGGDVGLRVGLFYDPGVTGWSGPSPATSNNRIAVARFDDEGLGGWDFTKTNGDFIFDDPPPYFEAIPYTSPATVYSDRITDFSPFTIGHGDNSILVLPVTLLRFEATLAGTDALLQWQVAPSASLSHFVVEHSINGQSFAPVQQLAGQVIPVYSYRHSGLTPGTHYYRLKIAEKAGSYTYSPTRQVTFIGYAETQIVQWQHGGPGHTKGQLTIYSQKPQAAQAMLIDMAGRVVKTYPLMLHQGLNTLPVHLPALAAGIYRLKVNTTDGKHKLLPVLQ